MNPQATPLRSGPLDGSPFHSTTYRWGDRNFAFVTDPRDDDHYLRWLRTYFSVEWHTLFAAAWLRGAGTCVDVGANLGAFSFPVASTGARVLAVEALPRNATLLSLGVAASSLEGRVTPVHAAAGECTGIATMSGTSAWGFMSNGEGVPVPMLTVDDLCDTYGFRDPDVVKIDVEGGERAVLRGMAATLRRRRPVLIVESNTYACWKSGYTYHDLLADLERRRYHLYMVAGPVLVPRHAGDMQETCVADYVASPERLAGAIGPLLVRPLTPEEQAARFSFDADQNDQCRWHVATMLRQHRREAARLQGAADLPRRLRAYGEPEVLAALQGE